MGNITVLFKLKLIKIMRLSTVSSKSLQIVELTAEETL